MATRERMREREVSPLRESESRYNELSRALKIDKDDLDEEFVRQPELYHEVGEEYAKAQGYRDEASREEKSVKGRVDRLLREGFTEKPSETRIANMVLEDDDYIEAQREQDAWARLATKWGMLREDFKQRGYSLKELSNLWSDGYFQANSAITRDAQERRAEEVHRRRRERD